MTLGTTGAIIGAMTGATATVMVMITTAKPSKR